MSSRRVDPPARDARSSSPARNGDRRAIVPFAALAILLALEVGAVLALNAGRFSYTLDDAYIHLALAENLALGHYGVNLGEPSAPSSSILWPFLLAPLARLPVGHLVPLAYNVALAFAIVALYSAIVRVIFPPGRSGLPAWFPEATVLVLIPATNLVGLVFHGMEHALHLAICLLLLLGILRERESGTVPRWLFAAIVVGPLVRYEGLALSGATVAYLVARRHARPALLAGGAAALLVVAFSLWLSRLGLGHLPTSVLAKTPHLSADARLFDLALNLKRNLTDRQGAVLWVGFVFLGSVILARGRPAADRLLAGWASAALLLHFAIGRFGWYNRYEIYVWTTVLLTTAFLFRVSLARALGDGKGPRAALFGAAFLAGICFPYTLAVFTNPVGASNIFQQQGQMHRFVTGFFPGASAANDIGTLAFRNDDYVLDLWGLASQAALQLRTHQDVPGWLDTDWIEREADAHGVRSAMLFARWFPNLPDDWIALGDLHLGRRKVSAARAMVTFYAVGTANVEPMRDALLAWKESLPSGVRFEFREDAEPGAARRSPASPPAH